METIENNKLIAEFIGCKEQKDPTKRWFGQFFNTHGERIGGSRKEPLLYHTSWDWLMPVYNKCMKSKQLRGDDEYRTLLIDGVIAADREQLHQAVVEFIKWYNEQDRFVCGSCGEMVNSVKHNEETETDECENCIV
jgi:hypothetical protein